MVKTGYSSNALGMAQKVKKYSAKAKLNTNSEILVKESNLGKSFFETFA
jgi:ubiquitin